MSSARHALAALLAVVAGFSARAEEGAEFFEKRVRPVLVEHCVKCHGPEKQKGGLRLDVKALAMKGGDDGAVIAPGKSAESRLVKFVESRVEDEMMPPKGARLSAEQVAVLRRWIDAGAVWPDDGKVARSGHWSLQPVRMTAVPKVAGAATELDAFVMAKLAAKGLALSPPADSATLIRRVTFDLIGLPPTPEEVDAFLDKRASKK